MTNICDRVDDDSSDDRCRVGCCTVGLAAVALPNFRHSAAQRHNGTLHNGTTARCTYPRHTLAEQGARSSTQSAPNQRPVQTHTCPLSSFCQLYRLHLTEIKWGGAEAGKWWKESESGESMQRPMVSFFGQILPMSWSSIRKQQT